MTLAIHGGEPVRVDPFPSANDGTGRSFGQDEIKAVTEVLNAGTLGRMHGTQVNSLEHEFAEYHSVRHAVASTSGTAALHIAVAAINPEPGDEIVVPAITNFGTVIPVLAAGAVPVFADVDPLTACVTADSVEAVLSERTRAVIVVHLFGCPADVDAIARRCRPRGVAVIEDCAQAYLAVPPGGDGLAGGRGDIGCFSLQQSKHITAGEGGLTITDRDELADRMWRFAHKGCPRNAPNRNFQALGLNYRMPELIGAVARVQLRGLRDVVAARRSIAARLVADLADRPGLTTHSNVDGHSYWMIPVLVDPAVLGVTNTEFCAALAAEGIPAVRRNLDTPTYLMPVLVDRATFGDSGFPLTAPPARRDWHYARGDCPVAETLIDERLFVIECNERYSDDDVADILTAIGKVHEHFLDRR